MHDLVFDENTSSKDQVGPSFLNPSLVGGSPLSHPKDVSSPPSYANIAQKKQGVSSGSSEDESFKQSKKGRKSKKEIQEEEEERIKTQGSQATIEMSYGRNKRNRPPKGVITPSPLGK